jgi:hypothetical protein
MTDAASNVDVKIGSERGFGLVFTAVFLIVALAPMISGGTPRYWSLAAAIALLVLTFAAPRALRIPNRLWFKFGMLLGAIVAPVVMLGVFVTTFIPIGLMLRLAGRDPLHRKLDPNTDSYWIVRTDPPGPMRNQF